MRHPRGTARGPALAWRGSKRRVVAWTLALMSCGGAPEPDDVEPPVPLRQREPQGHRDMSATVDALADAPTPAQLLELLAAGHEDARARLGPHVLRYTATFTSTPEDVPELPAVDATAPRPLEIQDTLELVWGSEPGAPDRFRLYQGDDEGVGRDLLVLDERVFTRLPHRGWIERPLEGGGAAHWQWLDDAQHSLRDVIQFAAPALSLAVASRDDEHVTLTLALADAHDAALQASSGPHAAWREDVRFDRVTGSVTLTRSTGLWTKGSVELAYHHQDVESRRVDGALTWSGEIRAVDQEELDTRLSEPPTFTSLPDRLRYEVEKRELLQNLAGS